MVDDVSWLLVNILKVSLEKFLILYLLISCFSVKQTEKRNLMHNVWASVLRMMPLYVHLIVRELMVFKCYV